MKEQKPPAKGLDQAGHTEAQGPQREQAPQRQERRARALVRGWWQRAGPAEAQGPQREQAPQEQEPEEQKRPAGETRRAVIGQTAQESRRAPQDILAATTLRLSPENAATAISSALALLFGAARAPRFRRCWKGRQTGNPAAGF